MPDALEVVSTGPLALIQDLGRTGYARLGVGRSGSFDRASHRLAQALVGNHDGAAGFEVALGGLSVRSDADMMVAVTGAPVEIRVGGTPVDQGAQFLVPSGELLSLGRCASGVRSYVAVAGGLAVQPTLGSRSTDVLSGLGPPLVRGGDVVPIGTPDGDQTLQSAASRSRAEGAAGIQCRAHPDGGHGTDRPAVIGVIAGPRDDWFVPAALETLRDSTYTVDPASNRVGVRLQGPTLTRTSDRELPSEPTLPGAIQVPPNGLPLILGPDGPVTGGYPVIAVVVEDDLDVLAQLRPGDPLRFRRFR